MFHRLQLRPIFSAALLLAVGPGVTHGFIVHNYKWPPNSEIVMHLHAGAPAMPLQDGSASWDASAADALRLWNEHLAGVQFKEAGAIVPAGGDRSNSVFFSDSIYGEAFGKNVLAVTVQYNPKGYTFTETDVIFNSANRWDSYRGAARRDDGGAVYDFHRVALHEFGHVLGLDHPDENGQPEAVALMRSIVSDLDHLTEDDINGAIYLYGGRITSPLSAISVQAGSRFSYQITANNKPSHYGAGNLPRGLQFDGSTGVVSGIPIEVGQFSVNLTAFSSGSWATATLPLAITPSPITSSLFRSAEPGQPFSYQITAVNDPVRYSAEGLPPGLSIDPESGLISGVPAVGGTFEVTVRSHGPAEEASAVITIVLGQPRITSVLHPLPAMLGEFFSLPVAANNLPEFFSATGLPSGLSIDQDTGLISGIATLSGTFEIKVTAHGVVDVTGVVRLTVHKVPDAPVAVLSGSGMAMAVDYARQRLYMAAEDRGIVVFDTATLAEIGTLPTGEAIQDLTLSPDGTVLWAANFKYDHLTAIDLETLSPVSEHRFEMGLRQVRAGLGGRLYVVSHRNGVHQFDPATGQTVTFSPYQNGDIHAAVTIDISRDGRTLYVGTTDVSPPTLVSYDISEPMARLIQQTTQGGPYDNGKSVAVSPNGQFVCYVSLRDTAGSPQAATPVRSTGNLDEVRGNVNPGYFMTARSPVVFSPDDSLLIQSMPDGGGIDVFETNGFTRVRSIALPNGTAPWPMAVDATSSYLFVALGASSGTAVYDLRPKSSPTQSPPPRSLLNVSTRLRTESGENALIAGFIITGTSDKKVLLRAIGSSLPLDGKMADPRVALFAASGESITANDNWNYARAEVLATGAAPAHEREAALVTTLPAGSYTAVVEGSESGIAVVELYDLSPGASKVANISTRGRVDRGDNAMIGGFIIGGDAPTRVIVRAAGPSLLASGVAGALEDTTMDLHDGNGTLLASNDDWRSDQQDEIAATSIQPTDDRESAIVRTLEPGNYTAVIRGKNDTVGVALVEVYNLDTN